MASNKPKIVGLYGVPGCGKTYLKDELKSSLAGKPVCFFYDGSEIIATVYGHDLEAFKQLPEQEKSRLREAAIRRIASQCAESGKIGVVTGHRDVLSRDGGRTSFDSCKSPKGYRTINLCLCKQDVACLLTDFVAVPDAEVEEINVARALSKLDELSPDVMLVLDADKTLVPHDAGKMFWERLHPKNNPLDTMFTNFGYSDNAFRQAMLYYEQHRQETFEQICDEVAKEVLLDQKVQIMLQTAASRNNVGVVVVTCGLRRVWEKVLQSASLAACNPAIIGGGKLDNGYFVTPDVKGIFESTLKCCDKRIRVSLLLVFRTRGADQWRTEDVLRSEKDLLRGDFRQVLLPDRVPMLKVPGLPVGTLAQLNLSAPKHWSLVLRNAGSKKTAKMLMSATRDATVSGRALQEAHRNIGWYLATEYLPDLIGLESFRLSHVQGGYTAGHRLRNESKTTIIVLMRGGEPMAFGVHDALPQAKFLHASQPSDIKLGHIQGQENIVVVDSVINSGKSIADHVNHIRNIHLPARIVVVAGGGSGAGNPERNGWAAEGTFRGGTDPGNRLFNPTDLD
ncbi:hypothetical protein BST61_g3557 [Cercospora zeina]